MKESLDRSESESQARAAVLIVHDRDLVVVHLQDHEIHPAQGEVSRRPLDHPRANPFRAELALGVKYGVYLSLGPSPVVLGTLLFRVFDDEGVTMGASDRCPTPQTGRECGVSGPPSR